MLSAATAYARARTTLTLTLISEVSLLARSTESIEMTGPYTATAGASLEPVHLETRTLEVDRTKKRIKVTCTLRCISRVTTRGAIVKN